MPHLAGGLDVATSAAASDWDMEDDHADTVNAEVESIAALIFFVIFIGALYFDIDGYCVLLGVAY